MVYAPPGAADKVYCGINVPPALTETVPRTAIANEMVAELMLPDAVAEVAEFEMKYAAPVAYVGSALLM